MGFRPEEASRAALAGGGDVERALQHLLDPDMAVQEPQRLPPGPVMNGTRVAIAGLKSRADLNGREGTVVEYVVERERYRVTLGDEVVSVKRDNLRAAGGGSQSSAELKSGAKQRGNVAFQQGDYELAIREFTNAINQDAGDFVLYSNRSAAFACQQNYMCAMKDAQQCITLNPNFAKGHGRLAAANHMIGNFPGAIRAYKEGLRLDPGNKIFEKGLHAAENRRKEQPAVAASVKHKSRSTAPPRNDRSNTAPPQHRAEPDPMEAFFANPTAAAEEFFQSMTGTAEPSPGAQAQSHGGYPRANTTARKRKTKDDDDCSIS